MPEYLTPGVYVEEVDTGSKPIEGVSTSTAGMVGVTERGPKNVPILVTSMGDYRRWFGGALNDDDFKNDSGFHCYLPSAIEGFFTNGGKRVYVTRILRDDANRSAVALFDRGTAASAGGTLLRGARQGTGTAVSGDFLSIVGEGTVQDGDWIRVGNGSQVEYRRVVGASRPSGHIALAQPLAHSHPQGTELRQIPIVASGGALTIGADAEAGATSLTLDGSAANLNDLAGNSAQRILEIGAAPNVEYRTINSVTGSGTSRTVTISSPLDASYAIGATVQPIELNPASPPNDVFVTAMSLDASAGSSVVFGQDLAGNFDDTATLVVIGLGTDNVDACRISELSRIELSNASSASYPAGTTVQAVTVTKFEKTIEALAAANNVITLRPTSDVSGLGVGQRIRIGTGATAVTRVIRNINAATRELTLTEAAPVVAVDTIIAPMYSLSSDTVSGAVTINLDSRVGLSEGDILAFGDGASTEYATILSLVTPVASGLNAGGVILAERLSRNYDSGSEINKVSVAFAPSAKLSRLVLGSQIGNDELLLSADAGFTANTDVAITVSSGAVRLHKLSSDADAVTVNDIEIDSDLESSHEPGVGIAVREPLISVQALDEGAWGDRLRISIEDESNGLVAGAQVKAVNNPTEIVLTTLNGVETGSVLELYESEESTSAIGSPLKVSSVNRANSRVTLSTGLSADQLNAVSNAGAAGQQLKVRSKEFRLTVFLMKPEDPNQPGRDTPADMEIYPNLSMDPRHSRYFASVIGRVDGPVRLADRRPEGASWYIRVEDLAQDAAESESLRMGPEILIDVQANGKHSPAKRALTNGSDSIPLLSDVDYIGVDANDPENRTGLHTLKNIEDISIVAAPGRTGATIQNAVITHCESMRYRFAVLDPVRAPNDSISDVKAQRQQYDTKYAALYHPWLVTQDPFASGLGTSSNYIVPPSGHVVGIYARTDIERGVHKSPANEVVKGVLGLQRNISTGEQDMLNPSPVNINVIRDFRSNNRGIRVWGGRVITSDSDWKYVNVRRLMIFVEHSIDRGLQWVVFEPNSEPLWARVRRTIANFLTTVWRNGGLEGATVEEAFFVKCDRTTMTQADIDNGRLICQIGIAPTKPAEFVIIQIGLWTANADS